MITELEIKKSELKPQEITKVFSESLQKWRDEEPLKDKGEKLFYCPVCTRSFNSLLEMHYSETTLRRRTLGS